MDLLPVHLAPGSKFDFQQYIKRSLEDDFKIFFGVRPVLWTMFVVFLLINVYCELVHGWSYIVGTVVVPTNQVLLVSISISSPRLCSSRFTFHICLSLQCVSI